MKKAIMIFLLFMLNQPIVLAYDSYNVHPEINEKAARQAKRLPSVLINIGLNNGIDSVVNGKKIYLWLREGGIREDDPINRANNHFHDPLKPWAEAGLNDASMGLSSLLFAQDQWWLEPVGNWSWKEGRSSYHEALTATDEAQREQKLAETFRCLGQIMHLIADASVPAHTRNDIHVFPLKFLGMTFGKRQTYESWAEAQWRKLNYTAMAVDPSLFSRAVYDSSAPLPISALWDQNKYDGTNPEVTWTTNPSIFEYGLAEYTNANCFSEDTIFTDYPHPRKDYTNAKLSEQYAKDGKFDKTWYIMGYQTERLAAYSYFRDKSELIPEDKWLYHLDKFVYESYADNLIPRAVGYSAGLLDYFFRGKIGISLPSSGIYSSAGDSATEFGRITLLAMNDTENEAMDNGTIELVARYRTVSGDPFQGTDLQASNDYFYSVVPESTGKTAIPRGVPVELVFDRGGAAIIPVNAVDVSLQVVYHGKLGMEDGAVAVGWKSISDPTPVEMVNNMDKICLNEKWYDADSQTAIDQVDLNHNGIPEWDIYQHKLQDIYVKVSPEYSAVQASSSDYTFASTGLNAGKLLRAYILSDAGTRLNHSHTATVVKTTTSDVFIHENNIFDGIWPGDMIKSDVEAFDDAAVCGSYGFSTPCAVRYAPPFYFFRGNYLWGPMATIFDNPEYPAGKKCDWQAL